MSAVRTVPELNNHEQNTDFADSPLETGGYLDDTMPPNTHYHHPHHPHQPGLHDDNKTAPFYLPGYVTPNMAHPLCNNALPAASHGDVSTLLTARASLHGNYKSQHTHTASMTLPSLLTPLPDFEDMLRHQVNVHIEDFRLGLQHTLTGHFSEFGSLMAAAGDATGNGDDGSGDGGGGEADFCEVLDQPTPAKCGRYDRDGNDGTFAVGGAHNGRVGVASYNTRSSASEYLRHVKHTHTHTIYTGHIYFSCGRESCFLENPQIDLTVDFLWLQC